ncbi:hypothetical protein Ddye_017200 [Dipteronia dyeriana]|uniref:GATA-type domain-containing protein n=1 Tax=Dipteronia dyeriana TaxID=168575 RepID=A0AAD9X0B2_9ROSI|nr:hypothetical protein Ddye_017200 [Dipteronia dyeriana]
MGKEGGLVSGNNIGNGQTCQNITNNLYAWPPLRMGSNVQPNVQGFAGQFSGSSSEVPLHTTLNHPHTNFTILNPNHQILPPPPLPTMNEYTVIEIPMSRVNRHQLGGGSSSLGDGGSGNPQLTFKDPYKRCTNYNCKTNDTPLWRKGPLGLKTLCNACGIKYKKDKDKRNAISSK